MVSHDTPQQRNHNKLKKQQKEIGLPDKAILSKSLFYPFPDVFRGVHNTILFFHPDLPLPDFVPECRKQQKYDCTQRLMMAQA